MTKMDRQPTSKFHLVAAIRNALKERFDDPTVEIQSVTTTVTRIRVQTERGPVYYNVKVSQEV